MPRGQACGAGWPKGLKDSKKRSDGRWQNRRTSSGNVFANSCGGRQTSIQFEGTQRQPAGVAHALFCSPRTNSLKLFATSLMHSSIPATTLLNGPNPRRMRRMEAERRWNCRLEKGACTWVIGEAPGTVGTARARRRAHSLVFYQFRSGGDECRRFQYCS